MRRFASGGWKKTHILPNGGLMLFYLVQSKKKHLKQIQV